MNITHFKHLLSQWILPHFCINCHKPTFDYDLCKSCELALPWLAGSGVVLPKTAALDDIQCVLKFEDDIVHWVHQFKFGNKLFYDRLFAHLMVEKLTLLTPINAVVAVPLARKRLQSRGYNQSDLLAKQIALNLDLPYLPNFLSKTKETQPQSKLSLRQRQKNLHNCFQLLPPRKVSPLLNSSKSPSTNPFTKLSAKKQHQLTESTDSIQGLLLVDDIITTGATVNNIAQVIRKSYPNITIQCWGIARPNL